MTVLWTHYWKQLSGESIPNLARYPENDSVTRADGSVSDNTHPMERVLEEVHEVSHRVGMGVKLQILDRPLEPHLPVEFAERDGVL